MTVHTLDVACSEQGFSPPQDGPAGSVCVQCRSDGLQTLVLTLDDSKCPGSCKVSRKEERSRVINMCRCSGSKSLSLSTFITSLQVRINRSL